LGPTPFPPIPFIEGFPDQSLGNGTYSDPLENGSAAYPIANCPQCAMMFSSGIRGAGDPAVYCPTGIPIANCPAVPGYVIGSNGTFPATSTLQSASEQVNAPENSIFVIDETTAMSEMGFALAANFNWAGQPGYPGVYDVSGWGAEGYTPDNQCSCPALDPGCIDGEGVAGTSVGLSCFNLLLKADRLANVLAAQIELCGASGTSPCTAALTALTSIFGQNDSINPYFEYDNEQVYSDLNGGLNFNDLCPFHSFSCCPSDCTHGVYSVMPAMSAPAPMLTNQASGLWLDGATATVGSLAQLQACIDNPGSIYCVNPDFYLTQSIYPHITGQSEQQVGLARYYALTRILQGYRWPPFYPTSACFANPVSGVCTSETADPTTIVATFSIPVGDITIDTTDVTDPGIPDTLDGIEYCDGSTNCVTGGTTLSGAPASVAPTDPIVSVSVLGPTRLLITLASPAGASPHYLRLAWTAPPGSVAYNAPMGSGGARDCISSTQTVTVDGVTTGFWALASYVQF
jgi:hypothetical protein